MSNFKRHALMALTPVLIASMVAAGGSPRYGLCERPPRPTTEEDRLFVDKQGYKPTLGHDRAEQYRRRLKRKGKHYKGHKHGGARK